LVFAFLALASAAPATTAERLVTQAEAKKWKPDTRRAWDYAKGRAGEVTIATVDMTGKLRQRNGYARVPMASTIKVMFMVAYMRKWDVRKRALTGHERDLMKAMIRRSNDSAANWFDSDLGPRPLVKLARKAQMKSFRWHETWGLSQTTARDQALFMRRLKRYVPPRHWQFASRQLEKITGSQRWGIGRIDRRGWRLMFKGGWGSGTGWANHQVVLMRKNGHRIGLAVTTRNSPSHGYASQTLEGTFQRLLRALPR
jgi:D-alanyl-D-alanine carboxypeptidase